MRSAYSDKAAGGSSAAQFDLEDYIYEMQRRGEGAAGSDQVADDVYAQLAQKEKDLILAAELGKALLERNQELTRQNERMAEDYSQQLEALEQAKHSLRRQFATLESESEARQIELAADARELRAQAARREEALKQAEAEKARLVAELTEQNQRLTAQLKESRRREERLASQLSAAREQFSLRKSSLQDHESHVEILREELDLMTERREELERRVTELTEECEVLNVALDEANERALVLERRGRENEQQLRQAQRQSLDIARGTGSTPLSRGIRGSPSPGSAGHRSLLSEMETSSDDDLPANLSPPPTVLELQREAMSAWRQLRALCRELQRRGIRSGDASGASSMDLGASGEPLSASSSGCSSSSEGEEDGDEGLGSLKAGRLSRVVSRLCRLVREGGAVSGPELLALQAELHRARESLSEAGRLLEQRNSQLRRAGEDAMQMQSKLGVCEAQLAATVEERDLARADLTSSGDTALLEARSLRDTALASRNAVQIELARTRIDVLQVNSQLMEAVQQKIELSQQLEQWQVDMQILLDDQMRQKLTEQERRRRNGQGPEGTLGDDSGMGNTPEKPPRRSTSRILGFFSR